LTIHDRRIDGGAVAVFAGMTIAANAELDKAMPVRG
jgi:hypothetical protein